MSSTIRYGLIGGVLITVILIALHYISFELSQSFSVAFAVGLLIPIIFMVLGVKAVRSQQDGLISFGEALKTSFLVFFIAAVISSFASMAFTQTFSEDTWQSIVDIQRENAKGIMEMAGMDESMMEEALDETLTIEKIKESTTGIGAVIFNLLGNAFIGLIIALIVSAIMKRNPTP